MIALKVIMSYNFDYSVCRWVLIPSLPFSVYDSYRKLSVISDRIEFAFS